jgi:uncharacterized protein
MPNIFADTAGWGHLVDATQAYHHRAATIYRGARQQGRTFITTNYILTELVALLISPLRIPHTHIVAFITGLKASPYVDIVHVDQTLDAQAWQLFVERPDKALSQNNLSNFVYPVTFYPLGNIV